MISTNTIKSNKWSRNTSKRLGRWNGSGKWTYSGRGRKGQNSRSGGGVPDWFEWGQTPLFRRMPKLKGFSNAKFKKHYNIINLSDLQKLADEWITDVTQEILLEKRIIRKKTFLLKLLGKGELKKKINIQVDTVSDSAKQAVEAAGWKIEILQNNPS